MADEADIAQQQNEKVMEAVLQYRKPIAKIHQIGECHFCGQSFEDGSLKLFCDGDCATRYNRYHGG